MRKKVILKLFLQFTIVGVIFSSMLVFLTKGHGTIPIIYLMSSPILLMYLFGILYFIYTKNMAAKLGLKFFYDSQLYFDLNVDKYNRFKQYVNSNNNKYWYSKGDDFYVRDHDMPFTFKNKEFKGNLVFVRFFKYEDDDSKLKVLLSASPNGDDWSKSIDWTFSIELTKLELEKF